MDERKILLVARLLLASLFGGLITSTVLVLVIVPAIYFLWRKRELNKI